MPGRLLNSEALIFCFFFLLTLLIYFPARHAGFVTDYIGFETNYDHCGFWHYYDCAGMKNFRYLQHAFSYVLYKTVGSGSIIWYLLYGLAYTISSFFGYRTLSLLFSRLTFPNGRMIAFFSAFIFILSPFNTEVVVWKVCIQYITVIICLFLSINQFLYYADDQKRKRVVYIVLLFLIALFSLEQAVILPPFLLMLGIVFYLRNSDKKYLKAGFIFSVPLFILTGGFFLLSKIVYGKWIMHYGSKALDGMFSLSTYSNFYKYFLKHLLLFRYWKHEYKSELLSYLDAPFVLLILTVIIISLLAYLTYRTVKKSDTAFLFLILLLGYIISMVPVASLFFTHDRLVANDRLAFIPSFFIYSLLVLFIIHIAGRFKFILLVLYIAIQSWYLLYTVRIWNESQQYMEAYIRNFNFYDHKQVVVLGVPHSHEGVWMMLMLGDNSGLAEVLEYRGKHAYTGQMLEVAQFNQITEHDALIADEQNDSLIHVSFKHFGSWFDKDGVGLLGNDFENENYSVKTSEYGYAITFRKLEKDHIIIYPDSLRWKYLYLPKFK